MRITHIFYFILLSGIFLSCTKEIEIDIPGHVEQVVIDGRIEPGMPPIVLISHSQEIYAPTDLNAFMSSFVTGATVTVSNGTNTVQLTEICTDNIPSGLEPYVAQVLGLDTADLATLHICGYTSFDTNIFGEVGKTYSLNVTVDGETYSAQTTIVQPTNFNYVYWKPDGNLTTHGYAWANLSDLPNHYDAYMWEAKRINTDTSGATIDQNFVKPFSPVFDDEFFDGLTFDFFYDNPMGYEDGVLDEYAGLYAIGDTVVIRLSKMDDAVYEFMEKKYLQLGTNGNPFATPTNIPTNIVGGALGIWAGYSPSYDTLICQP